MNVFLQFIFSVDGLKQHVRMDWIKEYDASYIDDKIIGLVQKNLSGVNDILAMVEKKATGKVVQTANLSGGLSESKRTSASNLGSERVSGQGHRQGCQDQEVHCPTAVQHHQAQAQA